MNLYRITNGGELVVASDDADCQRVMKEKWGEWYPFKRVRQSVEMQDGLDKHGNPRIVKMKPSQFRDWPRGIIPEGE